MIAAHHVAFHCRDRLAQERFYSEQFGFRRARVLNRGLPNEFVMLRLGSLCLEFFSTPPEAREESAGEQPVGFMHLAFEVPKLEPTIERLRSANIQPDPIIDCSDTVPGLRICFFRDPEGNIIELMEGWRDE
jgi:glyoxylase I family protein